MWLLKTEIMLKMVDTHTSTTIQKQLKWIMSKQFCINKYIAASRYYNNQVHELDSGHLAGPAHGTCGTQTCPQHCCQTLRLAQLSEMD
jgi:hypothetical protein